LDDLLGVPATADHAFFKLIHHPLFTGCLSVLLLAAGGGCAARQPVRSFSDLPQRVKPGDTLYVIDDTGTETKGRLLDLSASGLTLDIAGSPHPMSAVRVRQVQRYGDPLWNGMLIGAALGVPGALLADPPYGPCPGDPQRLCAESVVGQRVLGFGLMAAIGAGVDALIRGRHQEYLAPDQSARAARRVEISTRRGSSSGVFVTLRAR
jgi:hypothetical protein